MQHIYDSLRNRGKSTFLTLYMVSNVSIQFGQTIAVVLASEYMEKATTHCACLIDLCEYKI